MNPENRSSKKEIAKAKIIIVDDHPILRQGLGDLINQQEDLVVCGEAEDAPQAMKAIGALKPDLAIVDISLENNKRLGTDKRHHNSLSEPACSGSFYARGILVR